MTPADWTKALAPDVPWQQAYEMVRDQAAWQLELNVLWDGRRTVTTAELVEAMWPEALARGDGIVARRRLFKALAALATRGLSRYCTKGPARKHKTTGRPIVPWMWHAPNTDAPADPPRAEVVTCPHCGGTL